MADPASDGIGDRAAVRIKVFSPHSYGFRPGKRAHDAVRAGQGYIPEGYTRAVDMDLEKFFRLAETPSVYQDMNISSTVIKERPIR